MISDKVRVRFAPSPTGYLHIGGLRTALYNYLFAKNKNGTFILRIEDTDRNRFVEGAVNNLIDTLKWAGLHFDEGPENGGGYGPYFQSKRLDLYKEYAEELINKGKAYYCFCTSERLEKLREEQQKQKLPQAKYDKHCLNLTSEEINLNLANQNSFVIRLNVPADKKIIFNDLIRKQVEFDSSNIDDQVLIKSDGYPTYHLANVVDDHLMKITHVIRGEEWLSSTPKHILLYDFFEWEKPYFAHLPLLLNPDRSKLSKRQGDVAVEDYREKGYLKDALINFVAMLGWNAGDDKEFYKIDELINNFSIDRVNKSGAIFNTEKLNWLNAEHLRSMEIDDILLRLKKEISLSSFKDQNYSDDYLKLIIEAMQERVTFVKDFIEKSPYFFADPKEYDQTVVSKRWNQESASLLSKLIVEYEKLSIPSKEDYEITLKAFCDANKIGIGKIIHPLRLAVSGVGTGPGVYDIIYIIGKEKSIIRIKTAIEKLG